MSEIYNIIDKKKLDVVKKPISKAHGLPNECYTSKEYTLIERKKLFEDKWVVIGVASSIPNIGDIKPFDLLGIPLLLVRNKKDQIKVFHNICSHRGSKLVTELCKRKNIIRCPYHSWSYKIPNPCWRFPLEFLAQVFQNLQHIFYPPDSFLPFPFFPCQPCY